MDINFGIWSLIPPILAVALAFLTKNVILSLFVSLFSGCLILAYGNPWTALQTTFSDYLFVDMTSGSNAQTIVLMAVIGGFVALVEKSGGARAFARAISNKLTKPVSAQLACWLGGLAIYFSDSGNSLILGHHGHPAAHQHQHGVQLQPGLPAGHRGRPQRQPVR